MCHHCVVESVKERMLDRRSLFKGAAAATVALAAASAAPVPAKAAAGYHDMTHELHPDFPTYGGTSQLTMKRLYEFAKNGYNMFEYTINEHTGTHLDAPLHFTADGKSVAEIPVENLIVPLCIVDIREKAAANADAQVTPDDLKAWIAANGPLPKGCCVAMNSGWDAHVATPKFRNADDKKVMHFPGFHVEAAKLLLEDGNAAAIAVDSLSQDFGPSADFAFHYAWLGAGRWGLECIANLGALPAKGATLIVGAPKTRGGTGGPSRVFAMV